MSVESATYPKDLDVSLPSATDGLAEGDNHIRLIKSVLKNAFPNLNSPLSATNPNALVPIGAIILWSGLISAIPSGWVLCNGQVVARSDGGGNISTPNLADRFVIGAGNLAEWTTGGSKTPTITTTVAGHTLTAAEMPLHSHSVSDPGHTHALTDPGHAHAYIDRAIDPGLGFQAGSNAATSVEDDTTSAATTGISIASATTGITVGNAGSGGEHTHTATSSTTDGRPPFFALAYIMRY